MDVMLGSAKVYEFSKFRSGRNLYYDPTSCPVYEKTKIIDIFFARIGFTDSSHRRWGFRLKELA